METLASELAEALALKDRMKAGEIAGDDLDVITWVPLFWSRELKC
jgi:hypothetical protein